MELRQLAYVVAVAHHRNFTRAAEEMLVAQPALSVQVQNLERELGVRLFERTTRRVELTPAGGAFIVRAQRILAEASAAEREMAEYAGAVRGRVRIGAWGTINPDLPTLLAGFLVDHPDNDITISEENSDVMLQMIRSGELDVALPIMRDGLNLEDIEHVVFLDEPFVLIVNPTSRLAYRRQVAIEELTSVPLIVFKPGSVVRYLVERAFARVALVPRIVVETAETSAARAFVAAGVGAALIPRSVAERVGPPVAIVPIRHGPRRVSALAWRRSGGRTPATELFLVYARACLAPVVPGAVASREPDAAATRRPAGAPERGAPDLAAVMSAHPEAIRTPLAGVENGHAFEHHDA
jgi:DNA-binding transcriptional LysR family regulator